MGSVGLHSRVCLLALALSLGGVARAQGTSFVCYEVVGGGDPAPADLQLQRLALDGTVGWQTGAAPQTIASTTALETSPAACPDGDGGAIVVYVQEFTEGERKGDTDVVAQRFDAAGRPVWNGGAQPVAIAGSPQQECRPVALTDGSGGAFVVFQWTGPGGDTDLLGQRISAQGNLLWNRAQPTPIVASEYPERNPLLAPDGEGGLFVVCEWQGPEQDSDIMAQRVSRRGQLLWNDGLQAADVAASAHAERNATVVVDASGELLVFFELEYLRGDRKGNVDLCGQRLSPYGQPLWAHGDLLMVGATDEWEGNPMAVSDGAGGAVVAFETRPVAGGEAADTNLMTQRLAASGKPQWGEGNPVALGASPERERHPVGLPTGDGGAIWVYEAQTAAGDVNVVAQRFSAEGQPVWNEGQGPVPLAATPWLEQLAQVVPDSEGGGIVLFTATSTDETTKGDPDVRAARLAADGTLPWRDVTVAGGPGPQQHPYLAIVSSK